MQVSWAWAWACSCWRPALSPAAWMPPLTAAPAPCSPSRPLGSGWLLRLLEGGTTAAWASPSSAAPQTLPTATTATTANTTTAAVATTGTATESATATATATTTASHCVTARRGGRNCWLPSGARPQQATALQAPVPHPAPCLLQTTPPFGGGSATQRCRRRRRRRCPLPPPRPFGQRRCECETVLDEQESRKRPRGRRHLRRPTRQRQLLRCRLEHQKESGCGRPCHCCCCCCPPPPPSLRRRRRDPDCNR